MSTEELKSLADIAELSTASGSEVDKLADMANQIAILKDQLVESRKPTTMVKALAAQASKAKKELDEQDEIILQTKAAFLKENEARKKEHCAHMKTLKEHRAELARNANPLSVWGDEPELLSESDCEVNDEQGSAHGSVNDSAHGSVNDSAHGSVNGSAHGSVNGSAHDSENYRESYTQVAKKRSPKYTSNDVPKKPETMANYAPKHAYKKKCLAGKSCHFRIICVKLHTPEEMALFEKEHESWCAEQYAKKPNFRSQPCDNMVNTGNCRHGKRCRFKHPNDKIADDLVHQQSYY